MMKFIMKFFYYEIFHVIIKIIINNYFFNIKKKLGKIKILVFLNFNFFLQFLAY